MKSSTSPKSEPVYRALAIKKDPVTGFSEVYWKEGGGRYGVYTSANKARAAIRAYNLSFGVDPNTGIEDTTARG